MKNLLLVFCALGMAISGVAQDLDWALSTSSSGVDKYLDVKCDENTGACYSVGFVTNFNDINWTHSSGSFADASASYAVSSSVDAIITATDLNGNLLWNSVLSSSGQDRFTCIDINDEGELFIGGFISGDAQLNTPSGQHSIMSGSNEDGIILKLDLNGSYDSHKLLSTDGTDLIVDLVSHDGGFYLLSEHEIDNDDFVSDVSFEADLATATPVGVDPVTVPASDSRYQLRKVRDNWSVDWTNALEITEDHTPNIELPRHPRMATIENDVAIIGSFEGQNFRYSDQTQSYNEGWSSDNDSDIFVLRIGEDGNTVWAQPIVQWGAQTYGYGIVADCEGLYISGNATSSFLYWLNFPGFNTNAGSGNDMFIAKLNLDDGVTQWVEKPETGNDGGINAIYNLTTDHKGKVYGVGTYSEDIYLQGYYLENIASQDLVIISLERDGSYDWMFGLVSNSAVLGYGIDYVSDDQLVISGMAGSNMLLNGNNMGSSSANGLIANINLSNSIGTLCCNAPSFTMEVDRSFYCPGETVEFTIDPHDIDMFLEYRTSGSWTEIGEFTTSSYVISPAEAAEYRMRQDNPLCGAIYSNVVRVEPSDEAPLSPAGISCGLQLWMRADTLVNTSTNHNGTEGVPVEGWYSYSDPNVTAKSYNEMGETSADAGPAYSEQVQNFRPGIQFKGAENLVFSEFQINNVNELTTYIVAKSDSLDLNAHPVLMDFGRFPDGGLGLELGQNSVGAYLLGEQELEVSYNSPDYAMLAKSKVNADEAQVVLNQDTVITFSSSTGSLFEGADVLYDSAMDTDPTNGGPLTLGMRSSRFSTDDSYYGHVLEMIAYTQPVSDLEDQILTSYLNLKYSLIQFQEEPINLVNGSGDVIYESEGAYLGYRNGIAGVGRDDALDFIQRKAIGYQDLVTIGLLDGLPAEDESHLVWGNNGSPVSWETTGVPSEPQRMQRKWRVQQNRDLGTVRIVIGRADELGITHFISHNTDPNITTPDQIVCVQSNGNRRYVDVTVTDGMYFSFIGSPWSVSVNTSNDLCGQSNGQIQLDVDGGFGSYDFSWSNGVSGESINTQTGLTADNYSVTITDDGGCEYITSAEVSGSNSLTLLSETVTRVSCQGASDGTVTLQFDDPATSVEWNNGMNGSSINGLPGGTYSYTATNTDGCELNGDVTIVEPMVLAIQNLILTELTCTNTADAEIDGEITGGVGPYRVELVDLIGDGVNEILVESIVDTPGAFEFQSLEWRPYQIRVTDDHSCSLVYEFQPTVIAGNTLIIECPSNHTVGTNQDCEYLLEDLTAITTVSNNCNYEIVQLTAPGSQVWPEGDHPLTFAVGDGTLTDYCETTITVVDLDSPQFTTVPDTIFLPLENACAASMPDIESSFGYSDNCGISNFTQDIPAGTPVSNSQSIEVVIEDQAGNQQTASTFLQVFDQTPPSLDCPSEIVLSVLSECKVSVPEFDFADIQAQDNCALDYIEQSLDSGLSTLNDTTIVLNVYDVSGNVSSCHINLDVQDVAAPTINCVDDVVMANSSCGFVVPDYSFRPWYTDDCVVTEIVQSPSVGTVLNTGVHAIEITALDEAMNETTCSFEIEVLPNPSIAIHCSGSYVFEVNTGTCAYATNNLLDDLGITANSCLPYELTFSDPIDAELGLGDHAITVIATNDGGQSDSCDLIVTIEDNTAPSISCPTEINLSPNLDCTYTLPNLFDEGIIGVTEECSFSTSQSLPAGTEISTDTTVLFEATNAFGTTASCEVNVVIEPIEFELSCIDEVQQLSQTTSCDVVVPDYTSLITADGTCEMLYSIVQTPSPGSILEWEVGFHTVDFALNTTEGIQATCSLTIEVRDNSAPMVIASEDEVNIASGCEWPFALNDLIQVEDCHLFAVSSNIAEATPLNEGNYVIEITLIDEFDNSQSIEHQFEVVQATSASFQCPSGVVEIPLGANCEEVFPAFEDLVSVTNTCDQVLSFGEPISLAEHRYSVEAQLQGTSTDELCTFIIEFIDDDAPNILECPNDQTLEVEANCSVALPDYSSHVIVSDNCTDEIDLTITQTPEPGTLIQETTHVSMKVVDAAGNETSCDFEVEVEDTTAPIFECLQDQELAADNDCNALMPDFTASISVVDACDFEITQTPPVGSSLDIGMHQITLVADDGIQSTTCTFDLNVTDGTAPVIVDISQDSYPVGDNCAYVLLDPSEYINIQECGSYTINADFQEGHLFAPGAHTVTYEVEDEASNTSSVQVSFEILPNLAWSIVDCASAMEVSLDSDCVYVLEDFTDQVSMTSECETTFEVTQTPAIGTEFTAGDEITVELEVSNGFESQTCSFILTVIDSSTPVINCNDMEVEALTCFGVMPDPELLVDVIQECSTYEVISSLQEGEQLSIGTHDVTIEILDSFGESASCSVSVEVVDTTVPQLDCSSLQGATFTTDCAWQVPDLVGSISFSDNCNTSLSVSQDGIGEMLAPGTHEIVFNASDGANENSCAATIQVVDNVAPIPLCPEDLEIIVTDPNSCSAQVQYQLNLADNSCPDVSWDQVDGLPSGAFFPVGTTTNTFTVSDATNNANQCSFEVNVIDGVDPVIICSEPIVSCESIVVFDEPFYTDNCSDVVLEQLDHLEMSSGSQFPVGETTIHYKAIDAQGNWVMCGQSITVLESVQPDWSAIATPICQNETVIDLNDLVTYTGSYNWSGATSDGFIDPSTLAPGVHSVALTPVGVDCPVDSVQTFEILENPSGTFSTETTLCGLNNTIGFTTNANVSWLLPDGVTASSGTGDQNLEFVADTYGEHEFLVQLLSDDGCSAEFSTVLELVQPIVDVDDSYEYQWLTTEGELNLPYNGAADVEWELPATVLLQELDEQTVFLENLNVGSNTLYLTLSNDVCPSQEVEITIFIEDLLIPSGFSPNNDGFNDTFEVTGLEQYNQVKLAVFNRWGNEVYHTEAYVNDWQGHDMKGNQLEPDTYYVVLQLDDIEYKGYVVIKR